MTDTKTTITAGDDGTMVVTGTGQLDLHVGEDFGKVLGDAVASRRPVVVDLTDADFIDSAILQSIGAHGRTVYLRGDRMKVLVTPGSHPEYVLKTVGFEALLDVVSMVNEKAADR